RWCTTLRPSRTARTSASCPASTDFSPTGPASTHTPPLSLHDALPISHPGIVLHARKARFGEGRDIRKRRDALRALAVSSAKRIRSEEHTSELQSRSDLVCRLLLEKKKPLADRRRHPLPRQRPHLPRPP